MVVVSALSVRILLDDPAREAELMNLLSDFLCIEVAEFDSWMQVNDDKGNDVGEIEIERIGDD